MNCKVLNSDGLMVLIEIEFYTGKDVSNLVSQNLINVIFKRFIKTHVEHLATLSATIL